MNLLDVVTLGMSVYLAAEFVGWCYRTAKERSKNRAL